MISTLTKRLGELSPLPWACFLVAIVPALLGGGCAGVTFERESSSSTGIRYFESAPFLLVYSDGMGGLKWQIISLPDQTRIMSAKPVASGGKAQMTLNFQNGMLVSATAAGDTTAVPSAIIAAAQAVVPAIVKGLAAAAPAGTSPPGFPAPCLYKIVVNTEAATNGGSTIRFIGSQGAYSVRVPVAPAKGS